MHAGAFPREEAAGATPVPAGYPLAWPAGAARTDVRARAPYRGSLSVAVSELGDSLRLFAGDTGLPILGVVISSNVSLGVRRPTDPGVALWFAWDGALRCIAVDHYDRVEGNVHAVFEIIEARRRDMAQAGLSAVRAALAGFSVSAAPVG